MTTYLEPERQQARISILRAMIRQYEGQFNRERRESARISLQHGLDGLKKALELELQGIPSYLTGEPISDYACRTKDDTND